MKNGELIRACVSIDHQDWPFMWPSCQMAEINFAALIKARTEKTIRNHVYTATIPIRNGANVLIRALDKSDAHSRYFCATRVVLDCFTPGYEWLVGRIVDSGAENYPHREIYRPLDMTPRTLIASPWYQDGYLSWFLAQLARLGVKVGENFVPNIEGHKEFLDQYRDLPSHRDLAPRMQP